MKSQISKLFPSTTAKKPTSAKKSASKTSQAA
jgi:hypothetical protein